MPQRSLVDCFSQEIIDNILDNFRLDPNEEDYKNHAALEACSLVCRAFAPRCQYHIFSIIHLNGMGYEDDRGRRKRIYNMMLVKPHLASGVRHVSLMLSSKGMRSVVNQDDLTQPGLLSFLRERQITSIYIMSDFARGGDDDDEEDEDNNDDGDNMTYPNPRDIEKYFIQPFIQTAFITSLDIAFTVIRTSILACFPNLTELALLCPGFEPPVDNDYEKIAAPNPRAQLRTLKTSTRHHIEDILRICGPDVLPLFDLSRLRILKTYPGYNDEDTMILGRAFDICAESLEELELIGDFENTDNSWPVYNLARFPTLNILDLHLKFKLEEDPSAFPNHFIDHCRFLATISSPNTMRKVSLKLEIDAPEKLFPPHCLEAPGWDDVDNEFRRIADGKALEINLNVQWTVIRRLKVVDQEETLYEESYRKKLEEILRTTFVHAIREKFQHVRQNSEILFEITIDRCCVLNMPIRFS